MGKIPKEAIEKIRQKAIKRYKDKDFKLKHKKACKDYYKTHQHHATGKLKLQSQKDKMAITRKEWYKENPEKAKLKTEKSRLTNIKRETHKNEKNVNWHGGLSKINTKRILTNEHKDNIKQRDGYRCQQCFRHKSELSSPLLVHHIDFNKINDEDTNLITLCNPCHSQLSYDRQNWINHFKNVMIERGLN